MWFERTVLTHIDPSYCFNAFLPIIHPSNTFISWREMTAVRFLFSVNPINLSMLLGFLKFFGICLFLLSFPLPFVSPKQVVYISEWLSLDVHACLLSQLVTLLSKLPLLGLLMITFISLHSGFDLVSSFHTCTAIIRGAFNSSLKRSRQHNPDRVSTLILYSVKVYKSLMWVLWKVKASDD